MNDQIRGNIKVLVTGADGFLGNNIVRELLNRKIKVRAFVQKNSPIQTLDELSIEKIEGDILNLSEVEEAAKACDYIIHAAANTSIWPQRSEISWKVNYNGTLNVINAALKAKVNRVVAIGTATSFGYGTLAHPGNENSPFKSAKYGLDYIDSKRAAQQAILKSVEEDGLNAVILNPTFMLGPYDTKPSSGALLIALYKGEIPGYTNGGKNFVYVKDVAVAACNALEKGRKGECYLMANENLSYKAFNKLVAEELNIEAPKLKIPNVFILLYGLISQTVSKLTKKPPKVSYAVAQLSLITNYFTAAKAVNELDMPQTSIKIAINKAFDWFKKNGYM
ncbi:MAG: NAD-dependent epimerase/dehydratase family protein [Cyclobacteriaceae bacterium]|nr:NAD-dependent epimerase/dehydratase family protein [Cyclobacteriaceae bacterium]